MGNAAAAGAGRPSVAPHEPQVAADHLVVMVHGILGSPADWKFAADQFMEVLSDKVTVHCSPCNSSKTLQGVDIMGERLAQEIIGIVDKRPELKKISFISHSIGGLVARYAIGVLYRPFRRKPEDCKSFCSSENGGGTICGLEAVNFITVATPHLGSRGNKQVPFLFGLTAVENFACCVIHLIFRRTGQHLFLVDSQGQPPLLLRMLEDHDDLYFMSALKTFKRRAAYANVCYDHVVGWRTSSIRRDSEMPKWVDSINKAYPHIVYEEIINAESTESCSSTDYENDELEEIIVRGLRCVSWEKVDVSFHNSKQRSAAHSIIQVKDPALHMEGADVIQHMIDHFMT